MSVRRPVHHGWAFFERFGKKARGARIAANLTLRDPVTTFGQLPAHLAAVQMTPLVHHGGMQYAEP